MRAKAHLFKKGPYRLRKRTLSFLGKIEFLKER